MTTDTQKIDVLSVMDAQVKHTRQFGGAPSFQTMMEARDAVAELIAVLRHTVRLEEQGHFESWLGRYSPSGDAESVHTQWKQSADYADFEEVWADALDALTNAGVVV